MEKLEKKVKILTYYAFASTVILSLMLLFSFKKNNDVTNFDEINVKKINIIEKNVCVIMSPMSVKMSSEISCFFF